MVAEQATGARLGGVQTLRAAAALGVVLFHASAKAGAPLLIGEARVDIFFVISGLVLWLSRERYASPGAFLTDRFFRVVPLYWIATGAMVVGALLHVFSHLRLNLPHTTASFLFIPYPSPNGGHPLELWPVLGQGWTMNYEIFFYALFALALLLPRAAQLGGLCAAMLLLSSLGAILHPTHPALQFYTRSVILEFLAGVLVAAALTRAWLPSKWLAVTITIVGVVALVSPQLAALDAPRLIVRGLPAALILLGVVAMERAGLTVTNTLLMFLGKASFSIYLFHTFGVALADKLIGHRFGVAVEIGVCALAGLAVGVVAYYALERPLMRFIKAARRTGTLGAAPLGAAG